MKTRHIGPKQLRSNFLGHGIKKIENSVSKYHKIKANYIQFDYDNNLSLYLVNWFVSCFDFWDTKAQI